MPEDMSRYLAHPVSIRKITINVDKTKEVMNLPRVILIIFLKVQGEYTHFPET
ncbi:MAG: hypothetical protein WAW31_06975 [Smithella sp.]